MLTKEKVETREEIQQWAQEQQMYLQTQTTNITSGTQKKLLGLYMRYADLYRLPYALFTETVGRTLAYMARRGECKLPCMERFALEGKLTGIDAQES